MTRRRRIITAVGAATGIAAAMAVSAVLVLQSEWFQERVRERIVREVERATGGRAELGSFAFDWRALRAEVRDFVLHGTEGAEKPPLFRAKALRVGLKLVSLARKDVDIAFFGVEEPRIYLIVHPDGTTNVPEPRVRRAGKPAMETILDLAVARFQVEDGVFEIEKHGRTQFHAAGANLKARLGYDATGPRYRGEVAIEPLEVEWGGRPPEPVDVRVETEVHAGRIAVTAARLATEHSEVEFNGAVEDLARFHALFNYQARLQVGEFAEAVTGQVQSSGAARFEGLGRYEVTGGWTAAGVAWKQQVVPLAGFRGAGRLRLTPELLEAAGVRLSGDAWIARQKEPQRVEGRVQRVALRGARWEAAGVEIAALGGSFTGEAELRDRDAYRIAGKVAGLDAHRLVALYSERPAPWDGRISGPVRVEGSLKRRASLRAAIEAAIEPGGSGAPVRGLVEATYSAEGGTVDLGRSWIELPASRVEFAGVLGKELEVRAESRNLEDLLPALNVKSLAVRLEGPAGFRGKVLGPLEDPHIAGRLRAAGFIVTGRRFDGFQAEVAATRERIELREATISRGSLRARFEGAARLSDFRPADDLPVYGTASVSGAALEDALALAGMETIPASGTLEAAAKLTGRWGAPLVALEAAVAEGSLYGEPFDRLAAVVDHRPEATELKGGRIDSGSKRIEAQAVYRHEDGNLRAGRLRFSALSNGMPLAEVRRVHAAQPDLTGNLQFEAAGELEVRPQAVRLLELKGHAVADGLMLRGRRLGDVRLTAATRGGMLSARLASDFSGSSVRGTGEWRLAGDYPGKARVVFSKLDFIRLWHLLAAEEADGPVRVAGSAAGEVVVEGPLLQLQSSRASASIMQMHIGPAPGTELGDGPQDLALRNAGAVIATMANGVARIERARFVGRSTDLTIDGNINVLQRKNVLDLKLKGQVDLAMLQDLDRDLEASGVVTTEASVRGTVYNPQINGRMEIRNAAFSLATFPQGIYNANGVVAFNGSRATIQQLTGESGGGQVRVAGFASYENRGLLFRLFLRAQQVRVRYPEGVSTVANAALNWTGTRERSTLAGTVTIVRAGFNPQSDFSLILAQQAEPLRTPTSRAGLLGGTHFDVQIETATDIAFESSLAQDIQAEANLRLRGTGANPALLGRVNISQGRLVFFGTRFNINQGSVSFFNPSRIEPVLNVDLETRARGVDVTLTISGPISKLNLTPRSDPPLQFNEIVALLATGRAPTSDPALLARQNISPQSWQQMGASALLGQAIASPVAGRLQRFFGVTRLKIDPSLTGLDNNPQARLTLEQQVTPDITFTYITSVTNSNPLVVQVEWAVNRTWSVLAVREENGLFGLDFLLKKRF